MTDLGAKAWSNYWRKGFLSTFVDQEQENYTGPTKKYWDETFVSLADNAKLVDLGCGNGAILALAVAYMVEHDVIFNLTAVDYADIGRDSEFFTAHPDIEIRANTQIESTGIEVDSVDLCVSHFGFEYCNTREGAKEVGRILKPNGKFKALMHHHESNVAVRAASAIDQIVLCERSKLTETTTNLLRRLRKLAKSHRDPSKDEKAAKLRDHFNQMAQRVNEYADQLYDSDHVTYYLSELGNLFGPKAQNLSFDDKLNIVSQLEIDSEEYRQRMLAMVNASSNQEQIENLVAEFKNNGFEVDQPREFEADGQKFAWMFSATKTG